MSDRHARAWITAGVLLGGAVLGACELGGTTTATPGGDRSTPAALPSVLEQRIGEVLALRIPLLGGGQLDLATLQGRRVLLVLSDASWTQRAEDERRYEAWFQGDGSARTVVSVALDRDATDLPASWTDGSPSLVVAWDPQGAVAARLQAIAIPTVVMLDEQGRIVAVFEGRSPTEAELTRWSADGMAGATHA